MKISKNFPFAGSFLQAVVLGAALFLGVADVQSAEWARQAELKQAAGSAEPLSLLINALLDAPVRRNRQSSSLVDVLIDAEFIETLYAKRLDQLIKKRKKSKKSWGLSSNLCKLLNIR